MATTFDSKMVPD